MMEQNELRSTLSELGLLACADMLEAADVDLDALPLLDDADLREIGLSLGHRRKLLHAVTSGELTAVRGRLSQVEGTRPGHAHPERRRLTVLFCDLMDSTPLTQRFEPDEVAGLLRLFQERTAAAITRTGGHIETFMGDGVLAYFGYPLAQENAAEMAVRGGLAVIEAVAGITTSSGEKLAVRAAVDSGLAFIDEQRGGGDQLVAGTVLNLAARLQQVAPANSVVVSAEAGRMLHGLFDLHSLGHFTLKGFDRKLEALEVVGERTAPTRFAAGRPNAIAPVVGRGAEVELLLNRWEAARTGEGQVVLLEAEPGMGKSRLSKMLLDTVSSQPHHIIYYQCSAFHAHSALHPCITHLQRAARIVPEDDDAAKLDKLAALLARTGNPATSVPLAAALLSVELDERYAAPNLSADLLKNAILHMLVAQFLQLSTERPALLLVEDAHWIDPTTVEMLSILMERVPEVPAMVLVTFRPEFRAGSGRGNDSRSHWPQMAHATTLQLSRLSKRAAQELVEHTAGKTLPDEVLAQILRKTDGVPLFIEELTKAVLDLDILKEDGGSYVLQGPLPTLAIPTTLEDSLLARVDRLSAVKEIAQIGAVIGREFSFDQIAAMGGFERKELERALAQVMEAELIYPRGLPDQLTYIFKHALIQDAAYSTIILARRKQLHRRCAEILQELSPNTAEQQPELLAHHYGQGGQGLVAAEHWLRAGRRSVTRSANVEAIAHLESGLRALEDVDPSPDRQRTELLLRAELGMPNIAVFGYAAEKTWSGWAQARELAEKLGEAEHRARASYGLWAANASRGRMPEALLMAESLLADAAALGDTGMRVVGQRVRGLTKLLMGKLPEAEVDIGTMLAAYDPVVHRDLGFRFGQNPRVAASAAMALLRCLQCRDEESRAFSRTANEEAAELRHANSQAYAYTYGSCIVAMVRGDVEQAQTASDLLIDLSGRHRMGLWNAYGQLTRGWVMNRTGQAAEGAAAMAAGLDSYRACGSCLFEPIQAGLLAQAQARCGLLDEAAAQIDDALSMATDREELWCRPELLRFKAALLAQDNSAAGREAALAVLDAAAAEARTRRITLFERRCAEDRTRLAPG